MNSAPVGGGFDNGWNRPHRVGVQCACAAYVISFPNIDRNCRSDSRVYLSNMYYYTKENVALKPQ